MVIVTERFLLKNLYCLECTLIFISRIGWPISSSDLQKGVFQVNPDTAKRDFSRFKLVLFADQITDIGNDSTV